MNASIRKISLAAILFWAGTGCLFCQEKEAAVKGPDFKNQRIAISGDSITEQKVYTRYLEIYLLTTMPGADMRIIQYGWGGDTAAGFAQRMDNDLLPWKPGIVTICFGMNDGCYCKFNDNVGKNYEKNLRELVKRLSASGATVIVGSPGVVDTDTYKRPKSTADEYNESLGKLAEIAKKVAGEFKMPYADIHTVMLKGMKESKAAYGESYHIATDGVHPDANGHILMTYAFLKAMGFDGNIGKISMDFKSGKAEASEGHKILKSEPGKAMVQSSKYPFCFYPDTQKILSFVPFQNELNRLTLTVANLPSEKAEISWGGAKKTFTRNQLEKGVNLADEFVENNPFKKPFFDVMTVIGEKQNFETAMIKRFVTNTPWLEAQFKGDKEVADAQGALCGKLFDKNRELQKKVIETVKPVEHEIQVSPLK